MNQTNNFIVMNVVNVMNRNKIIACLLIVIAVQSQVQTVINTSKNGFASSPGFSSSNIAAAVSVYQPTSTQEKPKTHAELAALFPQINIYPASQRSQVQISQPKSQSQPQSQPQPQSQSQPQSQPYTQQYVNKPSYPIYQQYRQPQQQQPQSQPQYTQYPQQPYQYSQPTGMTASDYFRSANGLPPATGPQGNVIVAGSNNFNKGAGNVLFGWGNDVFADDSVAWGNQNKLTGTSLLAEGNNNELTGSNIYSYGNNNRLSGSYLDTVGNNNAITWGQNSRVFGENNNLRNSRNIDVIGNGVTVEGNNIRYPPSFKDITINYYV